MALTIASDGGRTRKSGGTLLDRSDVVKGARRLTIVIVGCVDGVDGRWVYWNWLLVGRVLEEIRNPQRLALSQAPVWRPGALVGSLTDWEVLVGRKRVSALANRIAPDEAATAEKGDDGLRKGRSVMEN
jgi:hypothetical protein